MLPRYKAAQYVTVNGGSFIGFMDIVGYCEMMQINELDWYKVRHNLRRQFCVQTNLNTETLTLNVENFYHMQTEFPQTFVDIIDTTKLRLRYCLIAKLKAIEYCYKTETEFFEQEKEIEKNIKTDDSQYSFKYSDDSSIFSKDNENADDNNKKQVLKYIIEDCMDIELLHFTENEIKSIESLHMNKSEGCSSNDNESERGNLLLTEKQSEKGLQKLLNKIIDQQENMQQEMRQNMQEIRNEIVQLKRQTGLLE